MDDHNIPTGKKRKSSKPSTYSPSRVPISEGSQATGKPSSSQRCSQSSSGTSHAASTAFDTRRQSNKARMTMKKRALRADSGGRSVKIVSPLPEHQNDALNISSNAISHLGAEHRATRTTLVNSTHVSQADRREEAGNVKRILAGNEQEHQDAAHDLMINSQRQLRAVMTTAHVHSQICQLLHWIRQVPARLNRHPTNPGMPLLKK
jgi:hypothetical protein